MLHGRKAAGKRARFGMEYIMLEKDHYKKIIFVCTGNTCRSPMAETIFKSFALEGAPGVFSRGLVVLFPEPSNPKAELVLKNHDLKLENHVATQLVQEDITKDTLLLAMTSSQKATMKSDYGISDFIFTLKEYVGEDGEIVDPYGGDLVDYENCYSELYRLVKKLVLRLNEEVKEEW